MPIKSARRTSTDAQLVYKVIHIYIVQHEPMHGAKNVQHILLTFFFLLFQVTVELVQKNQQQVRISLA